MSTMKNHLRSFLSRLALCGLAAPLILLAPALTRADTITTFDVSGTALNESGRNLGSCGGLIVRSFSGRFQVDVTTGTVESNGFDITFPGVPTFDNLFSSSRSGNDWFIQAFASTTPDLLDLIFPTAPNPGSLVLQVSRAKWST